jgi:hypothetical protein
MGAVGFGRAAVFGMSEGRSGVRPSSAKRPEPIRALILYGSYSFMAGGSWDDVDRDPAGRAGGRDERRSRAG